MFSDDLSEWAEVEFAMYSLGQCLGIFTAESGFYRSTLAYASPISVALYRALLQLEEAGVLESRTEPELQFRWVKGADLDEWFWPDGTPISERPHA